MGPYLTEPSAEDNEKGEAGEAYSHEDWFAIDSQELKATLSTASNHWGALKQMKIGKWERRTKSVQAFFIEPERARSDYLQVHGTTAGRFTFRKLKLQYLQARARSGQTPPHSGQDFE